MVRDGWNFHGDIAIQLEGIARECFSETDIPIDKIYNADCIENYSFIEVMVHVLRHKTMFNNKQDAIEKFIKKCAKYFGKSGNAIDQQIANNLFEEFKSIIDKKESGDLS